MKYDFTAIERKWQQFWAQRGTFATPNPGQAGFDPAKPKFYVLDMFPYPSGVGLHVGHPLGYIATDIVARYKRMRGFNVLHPMGYDAFGLPAEQFAVEHGVHPRVTTEQNIANMTRQLKQLGLSYDWDRCLSTTDPGYYRWTQWIFLQLFHSWFDPLLKKAQPISELVRKLQAEDYYVDANGELVVAGVDEDMAALGGTLVGVRKWFELTPEEQAELIDGQRLAYMDEVPVNWCPALGTVLANEEVTNEGRSERGNHPVFRRPLKQWMLRITAYADRLADDLESVNWPEAIKLMQRNWIGRSEGARVDFELWQEAAETPGNAAAPGAESAGEEEPEIITVFTTRPDTLFGATYMVLAPEHPLVDAITTSAQAAEVARYARQAAGKTDVDRQTEAAGGVKTGVFTGAYARNPVNGQRIPIWIADYVMMGYGTGAIMAVPAHDQRDFEFARQFGLPIVPVVQPDEKWLAAQAPADLASEKAGAALLARYQDRPGDFSVAFTGAGRGLNSANAEVSLNGLETEPAKKTITHWLRKKGLGRPQVQYKLRDWLFSRQRYWGEPFPILHGPEGQIAAVPEDELPVLLPEMENFQPASGDDPQAPPQPPLSRAPDSWKLAARGEQGPPWRREFNTMPQWAGSCWYYLRFLDPHNAGRFVGAEAERYWMKGGVDLYVGGVEHAVLHLLYARFWHKVLFDLGQVSTPEPFGRLYNQGYIQAYGYKDPRGIYVPATEVVTAEGKPAADVQDRDDVRLFHKGTPVTRDMGKMGKSLKNAIAPDEVCAEYGCDTLRLYEMYLGPLDQSKVWRTRDITGVHRFLQRVWRCLVDETSDRPLVSDRPAPLDLRRLVHKTLKRVTESMEGLSFNTAIAALIELNNELVKRYASDEQGKARSAETGVPREAAEALVLGLAPLAPHLAEELWQRLGHQTSLACQAWPAYDPALLVEDQVEYPVQVNGKLRGRVTVPADAADQAIEAAALADEKVKAAIGVLPIRKVLVIKGKMVNIVVG